MNLMEKQNGKFAFLFTDGSLTSSTQNENDFLKNPFFNNKEVMADKHQNWERTRQTLIERLKDRDDQESWATFVDIYRRRLHCVAIAAGLNDAESQDAVQETIVGVFKDIDKYVPTLGRFTPWLLTRLKWRIKDELRKRRHQEQSPRSSRSKTRTDTVERLPDEASLNREQASEAEWMDYLFKLAIEHIKVKIKPGDFQIFDLLVVKKLPVEKVAAMFGKTSNAIYIVKHRVWALLEEEIQELKKLGP
jgi:RNA polymerase sigma factor (sigma-70 family)